MSFLFETQDPPLLLWETKMNEFQVLLEAGVKLLSFWWPMILLSVGLLIYLNWKEASDV